MHGYGKNRFLAPKSGARNDNSQITPFAHQCVTLIRDPQSRALNELLLANLSPIIRGGGNSAGGTFERTLQISEQVVHVFNSHGQANQVRR